MKAATAIAELERRLGMTLEHALLTHQGLTRLQTHQALASTVTAGARESVTAHGLHRPTHERPGADSPSADPTQRWCSDCGKGRANVTGKSARTVGLHPSLALGPACIEAAAGWSGRTCTGHPAAAMERTHDQ